MRQPPAARRLERLVAASSVLARGSARPSPTHPPCSDTAPRCAGARAADRRGAWKRRGSTCSDPHADRTPRSATSQDGSNPGQALRGQRRQPQIHVTGERYPPRSSRAQPMPDRSGPRVPAASRRALRLSAVTRRGAASGVRRASITGVPIPVCTGVLRTIVVIPSSRLRCAC